MSSLKNKTIPTLLISILACTALLTLNSLNVNAATVLNVPSTSYPTIQSALNAANDGDTIKVASGTYNENINYDGYALAVSSGSSQPKSGITLQGEAGTIINGAVTLLYLKQFRIEGLTVTGDLTLGDCKAYGYLSNSVVSNVQVGSILSIGGPSNTVVDSQVKMLILKGANTKMEFPAYNTNVENNQLRGLAIQAGSHSNTIKGNTIAHGETGISEEPSKTFYTTGNNHFINNTIANNNVGIFLYCSTGDNGVASHSADQLLQNIIRDNAVGLTLSASSQFVVGNTIYHNDFFNNGVQAKINNPVTNVWDDGARKGNYWSDYTGTDGNGDGVGDTPYVINAENQDNYPLMRPYSAPNAPTPTPSPSTSATPSQNPSQSPSPSSSPSNSIQSQQPSTPASTPTQTPLSVGTNQESSVVPELTLVVVFAVMIAISLVALVFKRKAASTF